MNGRAAWKRSAGISSFPMEDVFFILLAVFNTNSWLTIFRLKLEVLFFKI